MSPTATFLLEERFAGALSGAEFNGARDHRLLAWRRRGEPKPLLGVGMLNPSRANEADNDQTVRVLMERTRRLGFDGFVIVNLYTYIATNPLDLKRAGYPTEDPTYELWRLVAEACPTFLCAWGAHARFTEAHRALAVLRETDTKTVCLGRTKDGAARHPLRIPYEQPLEAY